MKNIGIVGLGVVGSYISRLFNKKVNVNCKVNCYDTIISPYNTEDAKKAVDNSDIIFVCVPTPHRKGSGLNTTIVESVIRDYNPDLFIICSTLQPGTADRLMRCYGKKIVVQPEYLGETTNHPLSNIEQQKFLILGGNSEDVNKVISLYQEIYNANIRIRKVTALEAEIIKLSENRAIAYKVAQCQELYDVCKKAKIDYNLIREAVYGDDPRFNLWWTFVYEDKRGCNSPCIPKDVYGWETWAKEVGIDPELTSALLKYNDKLIKG